MVGVANNLIEFITTSGKHRTYLCVVADFKSYKKKDWM